MRKRLPLLLLSVVLALPFADFATAQREDASAGSEQQTDQESTESADGAESEGAAAPAEPPPPAIPTITRSTGGITVVPMGRRNTLPGRKGEVYA